MIENLRLQPIRVVVVDDHPMLREGTRTCLEQARGIQVVGEAGEGLTALRLVERHLPNVLILDLRLPDISGVEVARWVHSRFPEVALLILTGYDDVGYTHTLFQLGVRGYLQKTATPTEIVAAVRAVAAGRMIVVGEKANASPDGTLEPLTGREMEVLKLLVGGWRNVEIAEALAVSVKTVEYHVGNLLLKLGARSRSEVIVKAQQLGFPSPAAS